MRLFACDHCSNVVHYENTVCVVCEHRLGVAPDTERPTALVPEGDLWRSVATGTSWAPCANDDLFGCNRLVPPDRLGDFCDVCRHHRTIPSAVDPAVALALRRIGVAERHLFYSLRRWRLSAPTRAEDPSSGLAFDFLAETTEPDGTVDRVITGHADGVVTLSVAEADDLERETRRNRLGEPYRTVLGHFRHEIGHYYWDRLVRDGGRIEAFRSVFGDERIDYADALARHYASGPPDDWPGRFVSAYASSHPWEDFAETWAHHMHMVDALETARSFGLELAPRGSAAETLALDVDFDPYAVSGFGDLAHAWPPLTVAVNAINRSLGQPDLYPFVLSAAIEAKLAFVHALIAETSGAAGRAVG